ncbi:hypothetical protein EKQ63_08230 [Bacillus sp. BD59S]|nr:hypothetical protein EKQ63_08230 [Bacillus sp. BD59S]
MVLLERSRNKNRKEFRRKSAVITALFLFPCPLSMSRKNFIIPSFVSVFQVYVCPFCEMLHKLIETMTESMYFIHIRNIYPTLMGSKTPTSKFSESKEVRWGINCP